MAEETRDVRAKLIVEKTGDQQAFAGAADDVKALERAADSAGRELSQFDDLFEHAGRKAAEFGQLSEKGLEGTERAALEAKGALVALRGEMEAAKASGGAVGDADIARLRQLEQSYDSSIQRVGAWRKVQQDVKLEVDQTTHALGGQTEAIGGIDDIIRRVNPELANFAVKWGLAVGAVEVASAALREVKGTINEVVEALGGEKIEFVDTVSLEGMVNLLKLGKQEVASFGEQWEAFWNTSGGLMERFQAATDAMRGHTDAIESDSESVARAEEVRRRYNDAVAAAKEKLADAARAEADAQKQLAAGLDAIKAKLDPAVAAQQQYAKDAQTLADAFKAGLIPTTEEYVKLLADLAAKRDAATKKDAEAVSGLSALQKQVELTLQSLAKMSDAQLMGSGLAKAKEEVQGLVEGFRAAGKQIPQDLAVMAEKLGVVVGAMEIAGDNSASLATKQQELGTSAATAAPKVGELAAAQDTSAKAQAEANTATGAASGEIQKLLGVMSGYQAVITAIGTALQALAAVKFAAGPIAEMQAIGAAADATLAKLQAVAGFGAEG